MSLLSAKDNGSADVAFVSLQSCQSGISFQSSNSLRMRHMNATVKSEAASPTYVTSDGSIALTHPEEMFGDAQIRVGQGIVLSAKGRATPAGFVSIGVLASLVILSAAALIWTARRRI